jgi:hypothetical protein
LNPKPAAKVDDAAKVLLAPKPPPPFRSAEPRIIPKQSRSVFWFGVTFLIVIAAVGAGLFFHFLPN